MNWLETNGRGPAARKNHHVVSKSALVVGACIAVEIVGIRTWMHGGWLTKIRSVSIVDQGRANGPFLLFALRLGGRTIGSKSDSGFYLTLQIPHKNKRFIEQQELNVW